MAVSNLDFAAQVDAWTRKATNRMDAVFKQSTQKLFSNITAELSGGLVNVQTGFLRASAQASLSEIPPIDPTAKPAAGGSYAPQFGEITDDHSRRRTRPNDICRLDRQLCGAGSRRHVTHGAAAVCGITSLRLAVDRECYG
jgi:hypothetical protein